MKRPILIITFGYLIGMIGGLSIQNGIVLFCVLLFLALFMLFQKKNKEDRIAGIKTFGIFLCSFVVAVFVTHFKLQDYQTAYQEGEVKIIGVVVSEKKEKEYKDVYQIKVKSVNGDSSYQNKNVYLNCKKGKEKEEIELSYGDLIYVEGEYQKPSVRRNEAGFDYASYLRSVGIYGNVTKTGRMEVLKKKQTSFVFSLAYAFRASLRSKIERLFEGEEGNLLLGLLIGDISNLSQETNDNFRDSNLSHMLAVSGSHFSYILIGMETVIEKMKMGKRKGRIITILLLLFFIIVTGSSASVIRAGIMGILNIMAILLHRKPNTINHLFLSLLLLLLVNPFCIFQLGLQLSFGGTVGILLLDKKIKEKWKVEAGEVKGKKEKVIKSIKEMLSVTFSAQLVIFPIILYQFGTISFTFFISNLLVGAILGIVLFSGIICCFISYLFMPLAKILAFFVTFLLKVLLLIAKYSAALPLSKILIPIPPLFVIFLYYVFLIYFTLPIFQNNRQKWKRRIKLHFFKVCTLFCILMLFLVFFRQIPGPFTLYFIDVGQGDSSLIRTPYGTTMLIDGGGSRDSESFDVGEQTLLPYLLHRGIHSLDYVMVSHFDADHCNGLIPILENIKVKCLLISEQASISNEYLTICEIAKRKKIPVRTVKKGMTFYLDAVTKVSILHPQQELLQDGKGGLNVNAIVAKVTYLAEEREISILFTGDIEEDAEKVLLQEKKALEATILKVGHHGSKTSTTESFLEAIKPKIALIGVGENNTFGHPNTQVLKRLQEHKVSVYRTDQDGEIILTIKKNGKVVIKTQINEN